MTILEELMAYDPTDYSKRYRIFAAVKGYPRNTGEIADEARVTTGDAINHLAELEDHELIIAHSFDKQEWRLTP